MENKKWKSLSLASLIISVVPMATLIPVILKITLPEMVNTAWAGVNIICVVVGLILSIICVKGEESRNLVNIASTIISVLWCLLMIGMVVLALLLSFSLRNI